MRARTPCWPIAVGLSALVCHVLLTASEARAWDFNPLSLLPGGKSEAQEANDPRYRVPTRSIDRSLLEAGHPLPQAGHLQAVPQGRMQQAVPLVGMPQGGVPQGGMPQGAVHAGAVHQGAMPMPQGGVQQAAFHDPRRPLAARGPVPAQRAASAGAAPSGYQPNSIQITDAEPLPAAVPGPLSHSAAGAAQSALHQGRPLNLPMPFARKNPPGSAAAGRGATPGNSPAMAGHPGGVRNAHAVQYFKSDPSGRPTAVGANSGARQGESSLVAGGANQGRAAALPPRPTGSLGPNGRPADALEMSAATEPSPGTKPLVNQASSQTPAERLLVQAHHMSASAKTDADYTRLIETCSRIRASRPDATVGKYADELASWALNRRGQLKADAGRSREALLDFDDAIRVDPGRWRAIHNRGVLLAQAGEFEKAFDDFNRTIATNPEFAKAYSNRAALFVVAGDLQPALADYQKAIDLDANLAVAHRGRGRVCHLLGSLDEAVAHYDAAVQLDPKDSYAIASRADLLTDLGRYADAAREYDRSIGLDPQSPHAYRGSAWLLATCPDPSVRNPRLALERAKQAIELDSFEDSVSFDTLAAAQASAGDFSTAMQTVRRAIELSQDEERTVYQDRLLMYQHAQPYRIAPMRPVTQASFKDQ